MNYFGHAVAASWRKPSARFVLGAMLPDLASMLGTRVDRVDHPEVADGIAWHHLTDAVFHRLAGFRRWSRALSARLRTAGVDRGPSLAAGHVGVELLLDGVLVERHPEVAPLYTEALETAAPTAPHIRWRDAEPRLDHLASRLADRGLPVGYRDPVVVADRTCRVLLRRPRLAMPAARTQALAAELEALRPDIAAGLDDLMAALETGLG